MKTPRDFDVERIIPKREPTEAEILKEKIQELRKQFAQLQASKEPPKTSFVDSICALPFDKSLYMQPFPKDIEVPKYDKYDGNGDPHDHVRHFYALSMDFMHEDTFLMRLFPRSLRGQAMEWFTKLSPPIKTFDELARRFIQQYSYNIQHPMTVLDLCNVKQRVGEPFTTYLQRWRALYS